MYIVYIERVWLFFTSSRESTIYIYAARILSLGVDMMWSAPLVLRFHIYSVCSSSSSIVILLFSQRDILDRLHIILYMAPRILYPVTLSSMLCCITAHQLHESIAAAHSNIIHSSNLVYLACVVLSVRVIGFMITNERRWWDDEYIYICICTRTLSWWLKTGDR